MKTFAKLSLLAVAAWLLVFTADEPAQQPAAPLVVGQLAPDFRVKDSTGKQISLAKPFTGSREFIGGQRLEAISRPGLTPSQRPPNATPRA